MSDILAFRMSVITQDGNSALMVAAYNGYTEVVVELVNSGANLDLQNNVCYIETPFMWQWHNYVGTYVYT